MTFCVMCFSNNDLFDNYWILSNYLSCLDLKFEKLMLQWFPKRLRSLIYFKRKVSSTHMLTISQFTIYYINVDQHKTGKFLWYKKVVEFDFSHILHYINLYQYETG